MYMSKNLDRGIKDLSIFEIGPIFYGSQPGEQNTVICGLSAGKKFRLSWVEKERNVDVFDIKRDVVQTLVEAGYDSEKFYIDDNGPNYYHPGKSGRIFLNKGKDKVVANFGEIHPEIGDSFGLNKSAIGFEIFYENIPLPKRNKISRPMLKISNLQPVTREFAFLINDEIESDRICQIAKSINKDLITDVKSLEIETLKNLKNSKANNTLRAYQSDFKDFSSFCTKNSFSSMPSDPKIIALYLTHLSSFSKFSTLKRRLASIKVIHRLKGHYIDTKHPIIAENLMGIKRKMGIKQISKKPLLINDLKLIINVIDKEKNEYKKYQNRALLLIGFAGGFRRSELVSIEYEDIDFVNEGVKILVKRSKTDQTGLGMTKAIPYFENKIYCPVISLKEWITHAKINNGKIFNISDKTVALTIQKYALLAGLEKNKYAGHSLRSGFATSTAEIGADERSIMAMTGHKTTQMVRRYIQEANLFKNNALNKIKI